MIIHRMEQYSPEWWAVRAGIPTASCADKILTPKGKLSAQCRGYINDLIAESLGFGDEPYTNDHMQRGRDLEPEARAYYELMHDVEIEPVGFITNDDRTFGCSPDGLIGEDSGWECKCPKASTHIGYLLGGELPAYYRPQVHMSMAVSGLKRWVFQSYYPGLESLIVPVEWDEYTDTITEAIGGFVEQLKAARKKLGLDEKPELEQAA